MSMPVGTSKCVHMSAFSGGNPPLIDRWVGCPPIDLPPWVLVGHTLETRTYLYPTAGPWWSKLVHCTGSELPKQLAKMPEYAAHH